MLLGKSEKEEEVEEEEEENDITWLEAHELLFGSASSPEMVFLILLLTEGEMALLAGVVGDIRSSLSCSSSSLSSCDIPYTMAEALEAHLSLVECGSSSSSSSSSLSLSSSCAEDVTTCIELDTECYSRSK